MLFRSPGGTVELECLRMSPGHCRWQEGEAAALLLAVRAACRSSSACPWHWVLRMAVRNDPWHSFTMSCLTTGAGQLLTTRLLSRVALIFESGPIAAWRTAAVAALATSCASHPAMLPELEPALACLRKQFVRVSDRAGEMMPWSPPPGLALLLSAHAWGLTHQQAKLAQFLFDASGHTRWSRLETSAGGARLLAGSPALPRLPPSSPYAPAEPPPAPPALCQPPALPAVDCQPAPPPPSPPPLLLPPSPPPPSRSPSPPPPSPPPFTPPPSPPPPVVPVASRTRWKVGQYPQPQAACGSVPRVGCFYQTAHRGVVHVVAVLDRGVLCGSAAHDDLSEQGSDSEEDEPRPLIARVERILLSRHGFVDWSLPLQPEDAPTELRDDAARSALEHASRESDLLCASLVRDLKPGGRLTRQPSAHGMDRNPLLMGHPPPGFRLLLLPRQRLNRGFMSIVGANPGPKRQLSALLRDAFHMWRLDGCAGGCGTFINLRRRVRTHLVRVNGPVGPGRELRMRLSQEEAAAIPAYVVTPTLVRHRVHHLVLFLGFAAPQYLGVKGAAALMGVTDTSAGATLEWLLRLAGGGIQLPGELKPVAPASGTLRAMEMLGSAIQLDVATRLLRHADAMVMASESRLTLAEHFAGLGLATSAATQVWPGAKPLFFSDSCPLARHCLGSCWPEATVCDVAESKESRRRFPRRVFALIAGFPCNSHSGLARGVAFSGKLGSLDILLEALEPLKWGGEAPTIVLLENTSGILPGAFLALCARLLTSFGKDYHWLAGVACPSLHADVPCCRLRVYLLAVHKQRATDPASWPVLEDRARLEALLPIPIRHGLATTPGGQGAAPAPGAPEGRGM